MRHISPSPPMCTPDMPYRIDLRLSSELPLRRRRARSVALPEAPTVSHSADRTIWEALTGGEAVRIARLTLGGMLGRVEVHVIGVSVGRWTIRLA